LDHSVYTYELAKRDGQPPEVRLAMLLHDAHESLTSDVPSDVKPGELRGIQRQLDAAIVERFFTPGPDVWRAQAEVIKAYDARALIAEAVTVGPPRLAALAPDHLRRLGFNTPAYTVDNVVLLELINAHVVGDQWPVSRQTPAINRYMRLVETEMGHFSHIFPAFQGASR
jgi:hypothetical protein